MLGSWIVSIFWVVNNAALDMYVQICVLVPAFRPLGYIPETVGILCWVLQGQEKFTRQGRWKGCYSRWRDLCERVSCVCLDPA